jgi:hypothetical protein
MIFCGEHSSKGGFLLSPLVLVVAPGSRLVQGRIFTASGNGAR